MDFTSLPPEVNSIRIYSGPGPDSLWTAATAWNALADNFNGTAEDYLSVVSSLTSGRWEGAASEAAIAALTEFSQWLIGTAEVLRHTATQAGAAARAYQEALAMTVPPSVIAENRAARQSLQASNVFGQNASAIASTEAAYADMWIQDVAAMRFYAVSCALATKLLPFSEPASSAASEGLSASSGAVGEASAWTTPFDATKLLQVLSSVPRALQALSLPAALQQQHIPSDLVSLIDLVYQEGQIMTMPLTAASLLSGLLQSMVPSSTASAAEAVIGSGLPTTLAPTDAGLAKAGTDAFVSAGLSRASSVGGLSVPASWTSTATRTPASLPPGTGLTPFPETEAVDMNVPLLPGIPFGTGGRPSGAVPRYGFPVTVIPRPPAAG